MFATVFSPSNNLNNIASEGDVLQFPSGRYIACNSAHDAQESMQFLIVSSLELTVQSLTVSLDSESIGASDNWDASFRIQSMYENLENFQHWIVAALNTINNNVPDGKCDVLLSILGLFKFVFSLSNLLLQSARA